MSDPWEDERFGSENDLGEESPETGLEEGDRFDSAEGDDGELDEGELDDDDEQ